MNQQRKNVMSMRPKRKSKTTAAEETEEPEVEPHITDQKNLT
jgi:hypothetical protein